MSMPYPAFISAGPGIRASRISLVAEAAATDELDFLARTVILSRSVS